MGGDLETKRILNEIADELAAARQRHPSNGVSFALLMEEVGELAKATFEEPRMNVRKGAVQVAMLAIRVVLDSENTFDEWRSSPNPGLAKQIH